jgi:hypothetical protein
MQKAIRIPNIEGWVLTDRGILNTNDISCVMELRCERGGGNAGCVLRKLMKKVL